MIKSLAVAGAVGVLSALTLVAPADAATSTYAVQVKQRPAKIHGNGSVTVVFWLRCQAGFNAFEYSAGVRKATLSVAREGAQRPTSCPATAPGTGSPSTSPPPQAPSNAVGPPSTSTCRSTTARATSTPTTPRRSGSSADLTTRPIVYRGIDVVDLVGGQHLLSDRHRGLRSTDGLARPTWGHPNRFLI